MAKKKTLSREFAAVNWGLVMVVPGWAWWSGTEIPQTVVSLLLVIIPLVALWVAGAFGMKGEWGISETEGSGGGKDASTRFRPDPEDLA